MTRADLLFALAEDMSILKRCLLALHESAPKHPTRAQIELLFAIAHQPSQGVKELADRFCMTPSAVTQFINGLVQEKLLVRSDDPKDRRCTQLTVSARGKKQLSEIKKAHIASMMKLFSPLSIAELAALRRLLRKTIDHQV